MVLNFEILSNTNSGSEFGELFMENSNIVFQSEYFSLVEIALGAGDLNHSVKTHIIIINLI